jgi:hypothetical protein
MAKGTYEYLNSIIRQKALISPVIDAKSLIDEIDISDESQEVKDNELKIYRIANALAHNGFRVVKKGSSVYIDTKQTDNSKILRVLLKNVNADIKAKEKIEEALRRLLENESQTENQMCMVFDGTEINITEEMSVEQIVDLLRSIAI